MVMKETLFSFSHKMLLLFRPDYYTFLPYKINAQKSSFLRFRLHIIGKSSSDNIITIFSNTGHIFFIQRQTTLFSHKKHWTTPRKEIRNLKEEKWKLAAKIPAHAPSTFPRSSLEFYPRDPRCSFSPFVTTIL